MAPKKSCVTRFQRRQKKMTREEKRKIKENTSELLFQKIRNKRIGFVLSRQSVAERKPKNLAPNPRHKEKKKIFFFEPFHCVAHQRGTPFPRFF